MLNYYFSCECEREAPKRNSTWVEFSANRQNGPHQNQKLVGSSKSFGVWCFGLFCCVFNFVYILDSISFNEAEVFSFVCCAALCRAGVCATNDLLNIMLLKIEYKAIKIAATFPLNETISIVISLFSEQMNATKKTERQYDSHCHCYVHCLLRFSLSEHSYDKIKPRKRDATK